MKSVVVPRSVVKIGRGCFFGSALESITFEHGSELRRIGMMCFSHCRLMTSICIPKKVAYVGDMAFESTAVDSIAIEQGNRFLGTFGDTMIDFPGFVLHNKSWSLGPLWILGTFLLEFAWLRVAKMTATVRVRVLFAIPFLAGAAFVVMSLIIHPRFPRKYTSHLYRMAAIHFSEWPNSIVAQAALGAVGMIFLVSCSSALFVIACHMFLLLVCVVFFAMDGFTGRLRWSRRAIVVTVMLLMAAVWLLVCQ
jgi:hypothetical protein